MPNGYVKPKILMLVDRVPDETLGTVDALVLVLLYSGPDRPLLFFPLSFAEQTRCRHHQGSSSDRPSLRPRSAHPR